MGRFLAGSVSTLLFVAAGLFWWQGRAADQNTPRLLRPAAAAGPQLPLAGDADALGAPPPLPMPSMPPQADARTREQKRFDRYDRNRNGIITRAEMMSSRTSGFKRLDKDGNHLLSFEEWAVTTSDRFAGADGDTNGQLTPAEFATTAPKPRPAKAERCVCAEE